jgi:hypothetical protein
MPGSHIFNITYLRLKCEVLGAFSLLSDDMNTLQSIRRFMMIILHLVFESIILFNIELSEESFGISAASFIK